MNPFSLGVFMQPLHAPDESPTLTLQRDLDLIQHLDRLGFDEAWIGEHHSTGWETISSPEVFIAVAAERTRSIRLGTGITVLAHQHPLLIADRMSLLDQLTRGRVMLGMGVGAGLPTDAHVLGLEETDLVARFKESFEVIRRLLEDSTPVSAKTSWFELRDAVLQPPPFQRPHFPLAFATSNPELLQLAGRHRIRVLSADKPDQLPRTLAHLKVGNAEASLAQVQLAVHVFLADTREEAFELARQGAVQERLRFGVPILGQPRPEVPAASWIDELARGPTDIIGSPSDAVEKLQRLLEVAPGLGGILVRTKEWAPPEAMKRSYELLARFVVPEIRGELRNLRMAEQVARSHAQRRKLRSA